MELKDAMRLLEESLGDLERNPYNGIESFKTPPLTWDEHERIHTMELKGSC